MSVKEYIKETDKGRTCSHPRVAKYWEWGGGPAAGPFDHFVSVELTDGMQCEFKARADDYTDAIDQCNNFLNTIPE